MAISPILCCVARLLNSGRGSPVEVKKDSGVQNTMSKLPWATWLSVVGSVWAEPRNVALRSLLLRCAT